eukprot:99626_1
MIRTLRISHCMKQLRKRNRISSNALFTNDSETESDQEIEFNVYSNYKMKPKLTCNGSIVLLTADLICHIFGYLNFHDLLNIRHINNKYLSINVLSKHLSLLKISNKLNYKLHNELFQCNKFIFMGKFQTIKPYHLIPTKQTILPSTNTQNVREFGIEPSTKRRRLNLTMNSVPKHDTIKLLKVSQKYIIYVDNIYPPKRLSCSQIHVRNAITKEYIGHIIFKDYIISAIEIYNNLIVAGGYNDYNNNKKAKLKIYIITELINNKYWAG